MTRDGHIGVGIIGYGLAGRIFHSTLIQRVKPLTVTAIATRDEQRRFNAHADHPDARLYDDPHDVISDTRVQVVVIASPHQTHAPLAIATAQAGKVAVVDKVMCLNAAEGEAMIAAADAAGTLLSVFQNRRWDADFLTVREVLARGLVGVPYEINSAVTGFGLTPGYRLGARERPRGWRTYAEFGGGPFRDWGAHLLDQAVLLAGPAPVRLFADLQFRRDWDVETSGFAHLTYPSSTGGLGDGLRFTVEVGNISAVPRPRWYVRGSEGAYIQSGRDGQEQALHRGEVGPLGMPPEFAPRLLREVDGSLAEVPVQGQLGNYSAYYENILAAMRGEQPLAVTGRDVLPSIRLIDAAMASATSGQVVELS